MAGASLITKVDKAFHQLTELGLAEKRTALPGELSRGMKQKLAIACGLLHNPSALILDEPLTGLDPGGMRKMKNTIAARARAGSAVILSSHLLHLVEDLLFVAQMDEGRFVLDKTEFDLVEVLAEAVEAARPLADERGIELRGQSEPKLRLLGDRDRVAQVIDNLLSNALKFTPAGGEVSVDVARSNGNTRLVVADTGAGMRSDELGHLFERFYRTDAAATQAVQGSGLGLSICKAIVEAHGGVITADSVLGHGTSLTVELPTG
jgi:signal transduction histidine kinase